MCYNNKSEYSFYEGEINMRKYILLILVVATLTGSCYATEGLRVPILMFHRFTTKKDETNYTTVTQDKFEEVLEKLEEKGYKSITFEELKKYVDGKMELPEKVFLISIDDGYKDNYNLAYPVLKEKNMRALISVVGWSMGRERMLDEVTPIIPHFNWMELKEMIDSGVIEVGNHTFDMHKFDEEDDERDSVLKKNDESTTLYKRRFKSDIKKLSRQIEKNCGIEEKVFCYPYGMYNKTTEKILDDMGYKITLTTEEGINYLERGSSLKKLKRINISMETDMESMINDWELVV